MVTATLTTAHTDKGFTHGTHRRCSPEETWERIQPAFATAGLTRNADITGLDRVGIPVTLALRPNSPTMATSTGKGLTRMAALVSGAMEAMEVFHSEHVTLPVTVASHAEMAARGAVIPYDDLPLTRNSLFDPAGPEQWVTGPNLSGGDDVAVPLGLVALWDRAFVERGYLASFQMGSNGLASGNDWAEAMVSALLEVIERDAVTSHKVAETQTGLPPPRVRPESIASPAVQDLLERLRWAGITPYLHDCRTDTAVPVFSCYLYDPATPAVNLCVGFGAHLDPEIAMLRAVTEAAQGRLVIIAGSRDDVFRRNLRRTRAADLREWLAMHDAAPETPDAVDAASEAAATFSGDIEVLVAKLRDVGIRQVIGFDLSRDDFPFAVVRVVVPGLEGYLFDYYTPGRRALALARARAER